MQNGIILDILTFQSFGTESWGEKLTERKIHQNVQRETINSCTHLSIWLVDRTPLEVSVHFQLTFSHLKYLEICTTSHLLQNLKKKKKHDLCHSEDWHRKASWNVCDGGALSEEHQSLEVSIEMSNLIRCVFRKKNTTTKTKHPQNSWGKKSTK